MGMSKSKLTLSIDSNLIKTLKHLAIDNECTISEMIENYIRAMKKNRNIIKAIDDIIK
jgi:ribbon-helix-helix protein, copG family|nr:MAG TPA: MatP C-terminal ribbon-helix-helix domain [Caudoviricetes sp.]